MYFPLLFDVSDSMLPAFTQLGSFVFIVSSSATTIFFYVCYFRQVALKFYCIYIMFLTCFSQLKLLLSVLDTLNACWKFKQDIQCFSRSCIAVNVKLVCLFSAKIGNYSFFGIRLQNISIVEFGNGLLSLKAIILFDGDF